jgi:hypothetical protein
MPKEVQNTKKRYEIPKYGMRYRRDTPHLYIEELMYLSMITTPKESWLDEWPETIVSKLGENISRILNPIDVKEPNDIRSNDLPISMSNLIDVI